VRIAHINDIANVASVLAAEQRARGHEVEVFDPAKPGGSLGYPWKLASVPLRAIPIAAAILKVRRGRFDVVHLHYATHAAVGLLTGRPLVVHCHGSDVRGVGPETLRGRYLRAALRRAGGVFYSTPDLGAWVDALHAGARFMPNPIDVERFQPPEGAEAPSRDVLLGVRLDPIKGASVAIDAVARLIGRRPATTVSILADGPLTDAAVRALGKHATVEPRRAHRAMPDLLARHRVAVGQFRLGILSQAELEAMACEVPVVADFRFAAAYEEAPPILAAGDAASAAAELERVLEDEPLRRSLATRSRSWVQRFHDLRSVADRWDAVYGAVAERARPSLRR
jgi:glycosyltransferase involved in cell wall biosynthesis